MSLSGLSGTWTNLGSVEYGLRRRLWLWRGTGVSGTGPISLDHAALQEVGWSVEQVTGHNAADPDDAPVSGAVLTGTALALPDIGTPDPGDTVLVGFGFEATGDSFAIGAEFTALGSLDVGAGGNLRQIKTGQDSSAPLEETPDASWTTSGNGCGGIALIINTAPTPVVAADYSSFPKPKIREAVLRGEM